MFRRVIVSCDVLRRRRAVSTRVAEYVFGRRVKVHTGKGIKTYRYDGLIMQPAVEKIGQSVLIMMERDAEDFHSFLAGLGVPHTRRLVWAEF